MFDIEILAILNEAAKIFADMAPYLLLGIVFAGLLNIFFNKDMVAHQIGKNNLASVFKAALLGVPLPLCSCGVIPSAVYLSKSGASKGSVVSFLISTPQTGIDSIVATYGMLGWVFAIFRPIAALAMGIAGGAVIKFFDKEKNIKLIDKQFIPNAATAEPSGIKQKIRTAARYSFVEFLDDISSQFIVGVFIACLISFLIPDDFFQKSAINSGIAGMALMVLVGIPMYVCATASIPIAITLMMKGFSPGVAFVFLATGPATNAASLAIIIKMLGKKTTALYLAVIIISSIALGYLLDEIMALTGWNPIAFAQQHNHSDGFFPLWLNNTIAVIFFILILMSFYRKYIKNRFKSKEATILPINTIKINVEGMTCNHCAANVERAALSNNGVKSAKVNLSEKAVYLEGDFDISSVRLAIENIGYKTVD